MFVDPPDLVKRKGHEETGRFPVCNEELFHASLISVRIADLRVLENLTVTVDLARRWGTLQPVIDKGNRRRKPTGAKPSTYAVGTDGTVWRVAEMMSLFDLTEPIECHFSPASLGLRTSS